MKNTLVLFIVSYIPDAICIENWMYKNALVFFIILLTYWFDIDLNLNIYLNTSLIFPISCIYHLIYIPNLM